VIDHWTAREAAEHFEVPASTVYDWLRSGKLRSKRQGRRFWITTQALFNFVPPAGERIRPARAGESPRAGLVFGAAAQSIAWARERQEYLEREWAIVARAVEASADRS
jgi:excisionase family DNA binding protein